MIDINAPLNEPMARDWMERVAGSHINPKTLLATDYLNHFNEVIMLINMVADIPDVLADIQQWHFRTYQQHFLTGQLTYGPLAAEAYEHVPQPYKEAFEATVEKLRRVIAQTTQSIEHALAAGDITALKEMLPSAVDEMMRLVENAGAIIAGDDQRTAQGDVDRIFADNANHTAD